MRSMTSITWISLACGITLATMGAAFAGGRQTPTRANPPAPSVVLPISEGPTLVRVSGHRLLGRVSYSFWKPSAAAVQSMEATLPSDMTYYYRQYLGIAHGKQRYILINAFGAGISGAYIGGKSDWHRHVAAAPNGGTSFKHLVYNTSTGRYSAPVYDRSE